MTDIITTITIPDVPEKYLDDNCNNLKKMMDDLFIGSIGDGMVINVKIGYAGKTVFDKNYTEEDEIEIDYGEGVEGATCKDCAYYGREFYANNNDEIDVRTICQYHNCVLTEERIEKNCECFELKEEE